MSRQYDYMCNKVNLYTKEDIPDMPEFNIIKTNSTMEECYYKEQEINHFYDKSYFLYIEDKKCYKKDVCKPIHWVEEVDINDKKHT